jgi:uncharacterized protein
MSLESSTEVSSNGGEMSGFEAGLDGVTFTSNGCRLLGGFYKAAGETPRPTAVLLHGLPGIEKHLDIAYRLRDRGWNTLYFHFRGCWGAQGAYSLAGLTDDTEAAVEWVLKQSSVDPDRIALIGASTGSHPALLYGATHPSIQAIVGVSPVMAPSAFEFPEGLACEFAEMLNGISGQELLKQWRELEPLAGAVSRFAPRPILLVAAGKDNIFPAAQYTDLIAESSHIQLIENEESDHGFSTTRPWLVQTVTDWLVARLGS